MQKLHIQMQLPWVVDRFLVMQPQQQVQVLTVKPIIMQAQIQHQL